MGKLIKPVQANQTLGSSLPHKNVQVEPSILSKDTQITGINKMSSTEKKASVFSNIPAEEDLKETSEAQFTLTAALGKVDGITAAEALYVLAEKGVL